MKGSNPTKWLVRIRGCIVEMIWCTGLALLVPHNLVQEVAPPPPSLHTNHPRNRAVNPKPQSLAQGLIEQQAEICVPGSHTRHFQAHFPARSLQANRLRAHTLSARHHVTRHHVTLAGARRASKKRPFTFRVQLKGLNSTV